MIETVQAEAWLYTTLAAAPAVSAIVGTRIYAYDAPQDAALPYIVFSLQAPAVDTTVVNGVRLLTRALYLVKVVGSGRSPKTLEAAASAIDAAIHRASGTTVSAHVIQSARETVVSYPERDAGKSFHHLGGTYRLWVEPI